MKKKWSQRLLLICAMWQFIDGILTIILGFAGLNRIPELQGYAQFVPVATITGLVGTAFLLSGLVNLLLARYYLRRPTIGWGIPAVIGLESLAAYFCLDIISVILLIPTLVIIMLYRHQQQKTVSAAH